VTESDCQLAHRPLDLRAGERGERPSPPQATPLYRALRARYGSGVRSFNLLRYFTLASLGVIALLALATAWTFSRNLERNLVEEAGLYAYDVAAALNRSVFEEFLRPLAQRGEAMDLTRPEQQRALDAVIANRTRGLRVLTVNLFDRTGTIIYSTNPAYVGYRALDNRELEAALRGHSSTQLELAELERSIPREHDFVETYVPFLDLGATPGRRLPVLGALEIYQDGRPITHKIREGQREILGLTAALMALLFAALFAIVRRGDLRIRQLAFALEESNRELEARVAVRTREIERSRQRLQSLFDGIADGISVVDEDFRVVDANSGIARLFGAVDAPAARCHERYAGRAEPCPGCPALDTLRSGSAAVRRYRWPTEGGLERDVEVTTFLFTPAAGRRAVIEVVRDVSERTELERQVIQSEGLASLGELAAGVAHELRNPIGMISSAAQLLAPTAALSERDRELIGVVQKEAARLEATVSEFVNFAAPPKPSLVAVDARALLERAATMLRPEAERRQIRLRVSVEEGLPKFAGDPELLFRALANLVLNALQVQGPGGEVDLRAQREPGGIVVAVADRGPGIAEDDVGRVFQPFFSRRAGGTGLGLSIVQRIVQANGGRISLATGPGGTTFTLHFAELV
jgi:signal transduction histidine kinase